MIEYEFKRILSREQYEFLIMTQKKDCPEAKRGLQINHYYDTDDLELNKCGITVRIRHTAKGLKGTVKRHAKGEDFNKSEEMNFYVKQNESIPKSLEYDERMIEYKGLLVTDRITIPLDDGIMLMLDCNYFFGMLDYEMELEYESDKQETAIKYMENFDGMLSAIQGSFDSKAKAGISKSQRFFAMYSR